MVSEIAWAAGFFDGEGTTSILSAKRDKWEYVRMGVSQKEIGPLEKFQQAVNGLGRIYKVNTRQIYSWNVYKKEDVIEVLNILWPYLYETKKKQALKCFERLDKKND